MTMERIQLLQVGVRASQRAAAAQMRRITGDVFVSELVLTETVQQVQAVTTVVEEMNVQLAMRYDPDADPPTLAYHGEAAAGASEAAAAWRIKRLTFAPDGGVTSEWAGGVETFTHAWAARASLSYS